MPTIKNNGFKNSIDLFDYDEKEVVEKRMKNIDDCVPYKNTPSITWINIDRVPPLSFLEQLQLGFDLHPVIIEDIVGPDQRPKAEILDNYIYAVFRMLTINEESKKIVKEQVSLVLSDKFLMTFQQNIVGDTFEPVRNLIRKPGTRIRKLGTDYLAYELINSVVENYFKILEYFSDKIEKLEKDIITNPTNRNLNSIHSLKRQLISFRKSVWPLREVIGILERGESVLIKKSTRIYFRDSSERLIQIIDSVESYRDILSGLLDVYLSGISNRTNSVVKVLTIITTIFMPLSFLAGFYGMNFEFLPGLHSHYGPLVISGTMITVMMIMLAYFKQKEWL